MTAGRETTSVPTLDELFCDRIRHAVSQIDAAMEDTRMNDASLAWLRTIRTTLWDEEAL